MNNTVLQVKNLDVTLDSQEILKDISFSVKEQEVFVILGPNGAGKTTLFRALLNLIPYSGTISWHTKNVSYLPPKEFLGRKDIPPLSVHEFFLLKTSNTQQITNMLKLVGLEKTILRRQFTKLSTGQFQRMLIAWALVNDPDVLLFDEPTSGIDVGGEETIYSLLHSFWKQRNLTILLITHDLNIVWEHANNVLCLNKRVLCIGAPEQVLSPENLRQLYGAGIKFYRHKHMKE